MDSPIFKHPARITNIRVIAAKTSDIQSGQQKVNYNNEKWGHSACYCYLELWLILDLSLCLLL